MLIGVEPKVAISIGFCGAAKRSSVRSRKGLNEMMLEPLTIDCGGMKVAHHARTVGAESGVQRISVASHATAFALLSQNSNEDVCFGSGHAQPGISMNKHE
ncbi:hypothetical protein [Paraburkholderia tropica]